MVVPTLKLTEVMVATAVTGLIAMAFTPSEITAIMVAAGALVAVIFTGIVNIIVALRSERKLDHAITKVDEVHTEAKIITGHVNSSASASAAKIDSLQGQIDRLIQQVAEGKQTAAVLAQSTSDKGMMTPSVPVERERRVMDQIETNTAETARNTKDKS